MSGSIGTDEVLDRIEELEADNRDLALQVLASDGQAQDAYAAQQAAEAMLPAAYRAGVDRAKQIADEVEECGAYFGDGNVDGCNSIYQQGAQEVADIIRDIHPPTIEQLKEMTKESGDE